MGVSWEGTDIVMIFLTGKAFSVTTSWTGGDGILTSVTLNGMPAFSETTSWIGGDGILTSVTLNGPWAFRGTTCCMGGEAIEVWTIGKEG